MSKKGRNYVTYETFCDTENKSNTTFKENSAFRTFCQNILKCTQKIANSMSIFLRQT